MRQIKFRAMKESNGKWVYGQYAYRKDSNEHFIVDSLMHVDGWEWNADADYIKAETVGQYTGIKDKNGKEIYEGDIVRVSDSEIATFHEVKYYADESYPAFDLSPAFDLECNSFSSIANSPDFEIEVIGNIHKNPELLEK